MRIKATILHPNGDESIFQHGSIEQLLTSYPPAFCSPAEIIAEVVKTGGSAFQIGTKTRSDGTVTIRKTS